jgi:hypothetical protein
MGPLGAGDGLRESHRDRGSKTASRRRKPRRPAEVNGRTPQGVRVGIRPGTNPSPPSTVSITVRTRMPFTHPVTWWRGVEPPHLVRVEGGPAPSPGRSQRRAPGSAWLRRPTRRSSSASGGAESPLQVAIQRQLVDVLVRTRAGELVAIVRSLLRTAGACVGPGVSQVDLEMALSCGIDLRKRVWGTDSLRVATLKMCVVLVFEVGAWPVWPSARCVTAGLAEPMRRPGRAVTRGCSLAQEFRCHPSDAVHDAAVQRRRRDELLELDLVTLTCK